MKKEQLAKGYKVQQELSILERELKKLKGMEFSPWDGSYEHSRDLVYVPNVGMTKDIWNQMVYAIAENLTKMLSEKKREFEDI